MFSILFITLYSTNSFLLAHDAEETGSIKFYNIGGHCVLITRENRVPLLCDAGANSFRPINDRRDRNGRRTIVFPIAYDISQLYTDDFIINYDRSYPLSITISHPSKDHYNFIRDILLYIRELIQSPLRIRVVLGGDRIDYEQNLLATFIDFHRVQTNNLNGPIVEDEFMRFSGAIAMNTPIILDWLQFRQRADGTDAWNGPSLISHLFGQTDLGIRPRGARQSARNDMKSLIVRVEIPEWTAVIQGDAVNEQTQILINNLPELSSDILHASMQGGGVDSANSQAWARFVNPRFVVISAGCHGRHRHPRTDVMNRYNFQGNRLENVDRHFVHYYEHQNNPLGYALANPRRTRYRGLIAEIELAVYTTFSSGDITFDTLNPLPVLQVAPANLPPYLP